MPFHLDVIRLQWQKHVEAHRGAEWSFISLCSSLAFFSSPPLSLRRFPSPLAMVLSQRSWWVALSGNRFFPNPLLTNCCSIKLHKFGGYTPFSWRSERWRNTMSVFCSCGSPWSAVFPWQVSGRIYVISSHSAQQPLEPHDLDQDWHRQCCGELHFVGSTFKKTS